jgi:hypothetical protein
MRVSQLKTCLPYVLVFGLAACGFDGNELRRYLPTEVRNAISLYNERDLLFCAVSIYQLPEAADLEDLPLTKPSEATTDWLELPLAGKIDYGSFASQALYDGDNCFDNEAIQIMGMGKLSEYYSSERQGYFVEVRHDLILVHDTELNLIVISGRAR